ncbi:RNA methyltransferase [bacterium]|nr:RNA methyltransferase [bacterium]
MKGDMKSEWIWGLHSIEACGESYPELILEILVQKSNQVDHELNALLKKLNDQLGLKANVVERLPKALDDKRTQGVAAKIQEFPLLNFNKLKDTVSDQLDKGGQWLLLDRIQDPQNFGAILRSAAALGVKGVVIGTKDQCPFNGTVSHVSVGASFRVPIYQSSRPLEFLELARERGLDVLSLDASGDPISAYMDKTDVHGLVWIMGSEHWGVSPKYVEISNTKISIPLHAAVESLNVSNAAAIAIWEAQKIFHKH